MKKYLYTVLVLSLVLALNADARWPAVNSPVPGTDGQCLINDAGNVGASDCSSAGGAPTNATYITKTPNSSLSAEQALSTLSTGLMFVTTTTGTITSKVPTDDVVLIGNGTDWELKTITDCQGTGKAITYTAATNAFGCNTITGTGDALTSNPLSQFASTTSAQLAATLSDETGTGAACFATTPSFTTSIIMGSGEGTATVAQGSIRGPGAVGTDLSGTNIPITPGLGTGTGHIGVVAMRGAASKAVSGTTAHTSALLMQFGTPQNVHPGTSGFTTTSPAVTFTDENTAGSGTAALDVAHSFLGKTFAARNSSVTTTDATTVYITPSAGGTNNTVTNAYGLINTGDTRLDGTLKLTGIASGTQCLHASSTGVVSGTGSDCGGSGSTPAGAVGDIQYNNSGSFGGVTVLPRANGGECDAYVAPGTDVIQAAINALPTSGGVICLGTGTYTQTVGLTVGDGSTTQKSTRGGVILRGVLPASTEWVIAPPYDSKTILDCTALTSTPCIYVKGTLNAWGVENIEMQGNNVGAFGLYVTSAQDGFFRNSFLKGFGYAVTCSTWASFTTVGGNYDCAHNTFENLNISIPAGGHHGLNCSGENVLADCDFNNWRNIGIITADVGAIPVYVGYSDNNVFLNINVGSAVTTAVAFDYSHLSNSGPFSNHFISFEPYIGAFTVIGTPDTTRPNKIYGLNETNGAACPVDTPGLLVYGCIKDSVQETHYRAITAPGTPGAGYGAVYVDSTTKTLCLKNDVGTVTCTGGTGGSGDLVAPLVSSEVAITTTATLTISKMHLATATSAAYTVTLPACSGNTDKFVGLRISSTSTKLVTLDGNASETIDGALTRIMWAGESAIVKCDGTNWSKIAGKSIPMVGSMFLTTSSGTLTPSTFTKVLLDTVSVDNTGLMADAATNHRMTVRRGGVYTVTGVVSVSQGTVLAGDSVTAALFTHATTPARVLQGYGTTNKGSLSSASFSEAYTFTAGDLVELWASNDSVAATVIFGNAIHLTTLTLQESLSW